MSPGILFTIDIPGSGVLSVTNNFVLGLLFIGIAGFFRRVSLSGWGDWSKAREPIDPSLRASPAPMTTATDGVAGICTWVMGWCFLTFFGILALDQFLTQGTVVLAQFGVLSSMFIDFAKRAVDLFLGILSARQ